jgi:hypothetical protein
MHYNDFSMIIEDFKCAYNFEPNNIEPIVI